MGTPWYDKDKSASARQQAGKRMQLINDSAALEADTAKKETETVSPLSKVLDGVPQPQNPTIDTTDNISMLKSMIERPLTPDEVDKRKRAATNVAAVGHLGNMLSAYANLFGTTAGAAPQTLPGYQGPDVQSWEDKVRQKTIEYASIMNGLDRDEFERNMKEAQWANTLDRQKVEDERWNKTFNANQEQRAAENTFRQEQFEYNKERDKINDQFRKEENKSLDNYRQKQAEANQTRANNSGSRSGGTANNDTFIAGDYEYKIDRRNGNTAFRHQVFNSIPDEFIKLLPPEKRPTNYVDSPSQIASKELDIITRYAELNPDWAEQLSEKYPSVITRSKIETVAPGFSYGGSDNGKPDFSY